MRRPSLVPEWRRVAMRAWSVRLSLLAAGLSGLEVLLPMLDTQPDGWLSLAGGLTAVGAAVARVVAQPELWK